MLYCRYVKGINFGYDIWLACVGKKINYVILFLVMKIINVAALKSPLSTRQ